ncbi:hypothetical protein GCM10009848_18390 [Micromonospora lupini]
MASASLGLAVITGVVHTFNALDRCNPSTGSTFSGPCPTVLTDIINSLPWAGLVLAVGLMATQLIWKLRGIHVRQLIYDRMHISQARKELREAEDQVAEETNADHSLDLASLWTLTHKRLDYYHEIATGQSQASFRQAQYAMVAGFGVLLTSVAVAAFVQTTGAVIVAATLGATAAGLGGYVARTFLRSQETAASHLRAYFLQPLEFSRYLVVERLLSTLTDDAKTQGILLMVRGISSVRSDDEDGGSVRAEK